ncbi:hypothetical protein IC575_028554 [Cucumis melo]
MWLDLWLQGGPILKRVGEWVLFNAVSRYKARLLEFISSDGEWRWMRVSIELIDFVQYESGRLFMFEYWASVGLGLGSS